MKKLSLSVLVVLLTFLAALSASAAQPVMYDYNGAADVPFIDCAVLGPDYNFMLNDRWTTTERVSVFYNANGKVDQLISHAKGVDTLYRTDDPNGKTLVSEGSWVMQSIDLHTTPPTYEKTYVGPTYKYQLQGEKKIGFATGKITIIMDDADNWLDFVITGRSILPIWDIPAICGYFAQ